ncbi:uncharacterized protein TNCV_1735561 [Trichonephila clavipes]|nr:uncharacterized protein TNCV_1735561 [Trichonephila clavipes]
MPEGIRLFITPASLHYSRNTYCLHTGGMVTDSGRQKIFFDNGSPILHLNPEDKRLTFHVNTESSELVDNFTERKKYGPGWHLTHNFHSKFHGGAHRILSLRDNHVAAVAKWSRYRIVACLVASSSPVPLKTRRVGQRCTLNLSSAETSSRWCGVVVRRG